MKLILVAEVGHQAGPHESDRPVPRMLVFMLLLTMLTETFLETFRAG